MRTNFIIIYFSIMTCLIFGLVPQSSTHSPEQVMNIFSAEGDNCISSVDGMSGLPIITVNRDRSYHLLEILHQSDYDENNVFQIDSREDIYYNAMHPALVDSLVYCLYDSTAFTYVPVSTRKYYYAANGLDIVRIDWYNVQTPAIISVKNIFEYDSQHRLVHQYKYLWNSDTSSHQLNTRYHWIITDNLIAERYVVNMNASNQVSSYRKTVFLRDTQGRNIGFLGTTSPDSTNWVNASDAVTSYHPNDTSTGEDQIQYYSHEYVTDFYSRMGSYYVFSMISEFAARSWVGNDWVYTNKTEYLYDNDDLLSSFTEFSYSDTWHETRKYTCNYDANNLLSQFSYQTWNAVNSNWNGFLKISTLTWGEFTANSDENAPEIVFKMSVYPNPFNHAVQISLDGKSNAPVNMKVYNLKGQLIKTLTETGKSLVWDGKDRDNNPVGTGVYLLRAVQDGQSTCTKIIRLR